MAQQEIHIIIININIKNKTIDVQRFWNGYIYNKRLHSTNKDDMTNRTTLQYHDQRYIIYT